MAWAAARAIIASRRSARAIWRRSPSRFGAGARAPHRRPREIELGRTALEVRRGLLRGLRSRRSAADHGLIAKPPRRDVPEGRSARRRLARPDTEIWIFDAEVFECADGRQSVSKAAASAARRSGARGASIAAQLAPVAGPGVAARARVAFRQVGSSASSRQRAARIHCAAASRPRPEALPDGGAAREPSARSGVA